jgi:hypothetical protein
MVDRFDDRYFPSEEELSILIPLLKTYFNLPERSAQRKNVTKETCEAVKQFNPDHWTDARVRLWFNNNKANYLNKDLRKRIPTAQLRPPTAADPNLNVELGIAVREESSPVCESSLHNEEPEFPELPDVPQEGDQLHTDELKYQFYDLLRKTYNVLRQIGRYPKDRRLAAQMRGESHFGKILDQMHDVLNVQTIYSHDAAASLCRARLSDGDRRKVSEHSQLYASPNAIPGKATEFVEVAPGIFCPSVIYSNPRRLAPNVRENRDLVAFYRGDSEQTSLRIDDCQVIGFGESGTFAHVSFDKTMRSEVLTYAGRSVTTGFFRDARAILVREDLGHVWVAADCRVKAFDIQSLCCVSTMFAGETIMSQPSLAIWGESVVLASDSTVALWPVGPGESPRSGTARTLKNAQNEDGARYQGFDLKAIDWAVGRRPSSSFRPLTFPHAITCICAVGEYLAVGSRKHHAIHLLSSAAGTVSVLVGHTAGITTLLATSRNTLYSGSEDWTIKRWDINRHSTEMHFERHASAVTSLTFGDFLGRSWLFSGGEDHLVRAWDLVGKCSTFEVRSNEMTVAAVKFVPKSKSLFVALQETEGTDNLPTALGQSTIVKVITFQEKADEAPKGG